MSYICISLRYSIFYTNRFLTTTQVPKFQLADLFSKVGGILNLWAGITVVLLLELIEFILRVIVRLARKKKNIAALALAAQGIMTKNTVGVDKLVKEAM